MRIVVQRVSRAEVRVGGETVGKIGRGLLALIGIRESDTDREIQWLADKLSQLRIFEDDAGKMNLSLQDVQGSILLVSQFTLYGDARKGNRPNFLQAARRDMAEQLYKLFVSAMRARLGFERVATGIFQAMMEVELVNDGPVTILLDRDSPGTEGSAASGEAVL